MTSIIRRPVYLTFDIGTTSLKAALVDREGRVLAVCTDEYAATTPRPGWAEMPPQVYWDAAVAGTHRVLEQSKANPKDLAAIGFSSQGQTFVPIDRAGRPLYPAIVWMDKRAQEITSTWEAEWLPRREYQRITGYPSVIPELTAFKVAWLARRAPEAHGAWKFLCLPDFLIYRLTGEAASDYSIAQHTGFFNIQTRKWEQKMLDAAGISAEQLPDVFPPGTPVGSLREPAANDLGLPAGIPVCVGANDQLVGAVGAGNVHPGMVTETTGTALALVITTQALLDDDRFCVGNHPAPGLYFAMPFAPTSAIVLEWLRNLCAPEESYDSFLSQVDQVPAGCDGLTVLPHFAGTVTPAFNPRARGAFVGLTLGHTRAHLARAVMESCACLLAECLDPLRDYGLEAASIRSLGGAAKSDSWLQMKADLLGISVERPACSEAASLGAAMLAAAGTGQFASLKEAADSWYRPGKTFDPNPKLFGAYGEVYQRYLSVCQKLYGEKA